MSVPQRQVLLVVTASEVIELLVATVSCVTVLGGRMQESMRFIAQKHLGISAWLRPSHRGSAWRFFALENGKSYGTNGS